MNVSGRVKPLPSKQIDGVPLSVAQYSELLRIRGQQKFNGASLEDTLRDFIKTPGYPELPDDRDPTVSGTKQDAIKRVISKFQGAAKEVLIEKDQELAQRVASERERRRENVEPRTPSTFVDNTGGIQSPTSQ